VFNARVGNFNIVHEYHSEASGGHSREFTVRVYSVFILRETGFLLVITALEELTSASENVQTRGDAELVLNFLLHVDTFCVCTFANRL